VRLGGGEHGAWSMGLGAWGWRAESMERGADRVQGGGRRARQIAE